MAEAVDRWPGIAEGQVRFPVTPCGVCDERNNTGRGFIGLLPFSSANIIPPLFYSYSSFIYYLL
jgi:hypothetical protein